MACFRVTGDRQASRSPLRSPPDLYRCLIQFDTPSSSDSYCVDEPVLREVDFCPRPTEQAVEDIATICISRLKVVLCRPSHPLAAIELGDDGRLMNRKVGAKTRKGPKKRS